MSLLPSAASVRRGRTRAGIGLASMAVLAGLCATPALATPVQPAGSAPTLAALAAAEQTYFAPLVDSETTWRYLATGVDPSPTGDPNAWAQPSYDDSAWPSGKGGFGAKWDGTETPNFDGTLIARTMLPMRPGGGDNIPTYFFRTNVQVTPEQLATGEDIRFDGYVDDAAVVFVNGVEVKRHNVEADAPNVAYQRGWGGDLEFTIPAASFRAGANTIAVRLHQDRASSSDIWFSLDHLGGELPPPPPAPEVGPPSRIILTPTEDPYTSQYVTFQGAGIDDTRGRVQIKPAAGGPVRQVNAPIQPKSISNDFGHFSATITGLKPATEYTYRVSSGGEWSDWYTFSTADRNEKEYSYLYYGDAQVGLDSTWPKVVDAAMAKAPDAIGSVHAGDLIDTASNDSQWKNWFSGMETAAATTNVMAAPGNHEYSGDRLMTAWKAHFEYPLNNPNDSTIGDMAELAVGDTDVAKQYRAYFDHWADFAAETVYYADYQDTRFITVNATRDSNFLRPDVLPPCGSADCPSTKVAALWTEYQAQWLDHVLEHSESKWNVVTFHQPVYSTSSGRNEPVLREHWVPVFEKHNIDLVQMGHDHTYARGFKDTTATETPGVTNGPVYIVSNSGAKHYRLENDERNVWTNNGATQVQKAANVTTYQVVDVAEDTLTYRSYIAEINGTGVFYKNGVQVDAADYKVGDLWDEFTVHKSDHGQKAVVEAGMEAPDFEDLSAAPVITTDLVAETSVKPGTRVTLTVDAEADKALALQWQFRAGDGEWTDLEGETGKRLQLGRVVADDFGTAYRVVVTAGTKSVTSTETVLVDATGEPVFTTDLPEVTEVLSGDDVTLSVEAASDGRVSYRWQRLVDAEWVDMVGRTGPTLELKRVRTDGNQYRAVAVAGPHEVTSAATTVQVEEKAPAVQDTSVELDTTLYNRVTRKLTVQAQVSADGSRPTGEAQVTVKRRGNVVRNTKVAVGPDGVVSRELGNFNPFTPGNVVVEVTYLGDEGYASSTTSRRAFRTAKVASSTDVELARWNKKNRVLLVRGEVSTKAPATSQARVIVKRRGNTVRTRLVEVDRDGQIQHRFRNFNGFKQGRVRVIVRYTGDPVSRVSRDAVAATKAS